MRKYRSLYDQMPNLDSKEKKAAQRKPNTQHQRGGQNVQSGGGKGGAKAVLFACLDLEEKGPGNEEIPEMKRTRLPDG